MAIRLKRFKSVAMKQPAHVATPYAQLAPEQYLKHLVEIGDAQIRLHVALHKGIVIAQPAGVVLKGFSGRASKVLFKSECPARGATFRISRKPGNVSE